MASIYDFDGAFLNYRNKQRLNGGQIDPRVVGALAEADLNARYNDQKSRRALDLQEKSINNSYDLASKNLAQNASQFAQNMRAQKSTGGTNALLAAAGLIPSIAGAGKSLGLWGQEAPDPLRESMTKYYTMLANQNQPQPTQTNYTQVPNNYYGDIADTISNIGNLYDAANMFTAVPEGFYDAPANFQLSEFMSPDSMQSTVDTDWMKLFDGWF